MPTALVGGPSPIESAPLPDLPTERRRAFRKPSTLDSSVRGICEIYAVAKSLRRDAYGPEWLKPTNRGSKRPHKSLGAMWSSLASNSAKKPQSAQPLVPVSHHEQAVTHANEQVAQ